MSKQGLKMNQVAVALLVATLSSLGGVTVTASDTKTNAVSSAAVNKAEDRKSVV